MPKRPVSPARKITYGAAGSALIVLLLAVSTLIPTLDLTLAALAALVLYILLLEMGKGSALTAYAVGTILAFLLLPEKSSACFFLVFFGWYPFLREAVKLLPLWLSRAVKLAAAILAAGLFCLLFVVLFPMPEFFDLLRPAVALLFLAVFVLYDLGLSKLLIFYERVLRPKIIRK